MRFSKEDKARYEKIFADKFLKEHADEIRSVKKGNIVDVRAICEFSNVCKKNCAYCGLRCSKKITRYRMGKNEIVDTVLAAHEVGYRTIVLQSGEDPFYTKEKIAAIIKAIKKYCDIAITLSAGERDEETLSAWKTCGMERYLLKFETESDALYRRLHQGETLAGRLAVSRTIKKLGIENGSGFMVGLSPQEDIVKAVMTLKAIEADMAGIGVFIPSPNTPMENISAGSAQKAERAVSLARVMMPDSNLPVTTSLILKGEKKNPFEGGANVIMQKVTPAHYAAHYEIYPAERKNNLSIAEQREILNETILKCGRVPR